MEVKLNIEDLQIENRKLQEKLDEAHETLEAIRTGQVDALIVQGEKGPQIYSLKSADQTYRLFIEKMNEGAVTLSREGYILYCNTRFSKMVGEPMTNVVGKEFYDFVDDNHAENFRSVLQDSWEHEIKGEIGLKSGKNNVASFLYSVTTLDLDDGRALSIIFTDLSSQKKSELQLKIKNRQLQEAREIAEKLNLELEDKVQERTRELFVSRQHFKFMADNIPVIAWTTDFEGSPTYFNQRWFEFTGQDHMPVTLMDWVNLVHPDDRAETLRAWNLSIETTQPFRVEYRLLRGADKNYVWHLGSALPYNSDEGDVVAWFGISSDIDVQKKELQQKDEFISMVSHELKTPVTSLKGFTQLLMSQIAQEGNEALQGYLETMDKQITKLTRLIADLLDATRFNSGKLQYNEEHFDINELVKEVVDEMQLTTSRHEIAMNLTGSEMFFGDRNRIGQVITNLLSNAIKYSPNNKQISIITRLKDGHIEFCVKDFGVGISKPHQGKLYSRFFRADEKIAKSFPGMGLGLYISINIVEQHNGRMWVKSEPGKGTESYFSLPLQSQAVSTARV